jgi:translation initiation factor 4G
MQEADRGHVGIGTWDIVFPGLDEQRLPVLEQLVRRGTDTYCHYSMFLIAEVDGIPAAAVAGYVPKLVSDELMDVCTEAMAPQGWTRDRVIVAFDGARSRNYFTVARPEDTLVVEWVATRPEHRGRGLNGTLLSTLLENAHRDGHQSAHVGTYMENAPALAAYQRAGFEIWAEVRHADFEKNFRAPGLVFLRRKL